MKTTNWLNIAVAALILAFILAACPLPNDTDNTGSEIESINWVIDNIDSSFPESIPSSASIQFFINFETPGLTASDIASVYIESPIKDISWVLANSAKITEGYDAEENYFWCRLSSSSSSTNGSVLPVGTYNFTVRYSNGSVAKSSLLVPAPGATVIGSTSYVYTEDYMAASNPPSDYAALPRRANNISAVLSASELAIKFSVDDGKIYNSRIRFYDSEQAYVGKTGWLRNFSTGSVSSALNDGKLHNDGTENTLVLSESDIEFAEGKGMTDIDSLFIILTDGFQHVSNVRTYDTTSISQKVEVATTGIEIESINWGIDNIDSSFSESIPYSAGIQFFINFETPGPTASDITSVYIESPISDISWVIANSAQITAWYDAEGNYFWCRLFSTSLSTNGSVLPVGTYKFTVRYSNGSIAKSSLLLPAPGAIETGSTLYVYTEDYMEALNPPSDYAALPRRANNISAVLSASELTIKFSVNDGNIYNSEVWFYDSEQAYIGTTNWFRDFSTGSVSSALNDGKLHNDGTENTLVLSESGIEFAEGKGMTDIDSLFIILTDGIQHVSNVRTYDTTSISQKVEVATAGIEIESINWGIDNIDSSFSESIPYSAGIQFFINFETPGPTASDIASVYIESPIRDISWKIADPDQITALYNAGENYFQCRLFSTSLSTNGSVLPVGTYNFTVRYSNGSIAKSSLLVPAPGAIETGSTLYVYTEDYMEALNPPSDYAALPRRANNISAVLSASELTIKFSVNDGNIYNSEVWFYDSEQAYIGTTNWFRDFSTGSVSSALNDGKLHNDGTENTLVLSESGIEFAEGKGMTDIDSLFIILTDGIQHVSNVRTYDTTSISQKVEVATTGIEIESINWIIDSRDASFSESVPYSASIQFFIYFETPGPTASDIASVHIESPIRDISWKIADPAQITVLYNAGGNFFWCQLFSESPSTNGSVLPVGTYNFTIRYSNGSIAKSSLLVPAPGEIETGSTLYVYTEDYMEASNPPSDYAALPRRANNISAVRSASELTIKFSVNDNKIYNSEVWFYDSEQAYIGTTDWFRDFSTGSVSSALNDGKLHNDGTENTLVLSESGIEFAEGKGMNDIDSLLIILTDGIQYTSNDRNYDTRSVSQRVSVVTTGIEIESINWGIDNIDASFSESIPYSASIQFFINFETPGPTASDIASVHIESPIRDILWKIADPAQITALYNAGENYFQCRLYSESPSVNGSVLPVGTYKFTITYSNGSIAKSSLLVPAPGAIVTGSTLYVYTEDYMGASNPPSDYAALPRRANNISAGRSASELTIKFSVDDGKIYNSKVLFYDSEQAYVGTTDWFRDFSTGSVSSALNDGKLHNDGTENTLVLSESDIQFAVGKGMNDIDSLFIFLTDGIQYASNNRAFDTRSVSQRVSVGTN